MSHGNSIDRRKHEMFNELLLQIATSNELDYGILFINIEAQARAYEKQNVSTHIMC